MVTYTKKVDSLGHYNVIVLGSGSAGSPAAIAAARQGASTLLIERLPFLGGTSTAVLDTFYGFYTPGTPSKRVVGGIGNDVCKGLQQYASFVERPNTHGAGTGVTYHPEYLKVVWETLARDAGVHVLLNAFVQDVETDGHRLRRLIVGTTLGLHEVTADVFVDASGDANLCHYAGFEYEVAGDLEPAQTLTTTFKLVNVDVPKRKTVAKTDFHQLMAAASESGDYDLPRKEGSDHITPVDHMTATIMTRLDSYRRTEDGRLINATDPQLLSDAEQAGRLQALEYIRFLQDRVPGYENAQLSTFGTTIGVRETRRVYGEYRINKDDVLSARQFDDQIGLCGAPIEDHHGGTDTKWAYLPQGQCVGIPYRTLIPKGAENLFVAGRCFSATHDAHASVRSMGQCMVMGEAAGTAAARCAAKKLAPQEVPTDELRDHLRKHGGVLEV
ncbi:MAG: FAD-dependent oxidoreductase [Planctomycetota bacterium]